MKTKKTNEYILNISRVLNQATEDHKKRGRQWYMAARVEAYRISQDTGVPLITACGVIAALSPRNKWLRNLTDARNLCARTPGARYATFKSNVDKALAILETSDKAEITRLLGGKKTTAFFDNIYDPSSCRVTVDVHMQLVALGTYLKEDERPSLTDKMYREIEEAVCQVAARHGIKPFEAQAIAWVTWKETT